MTSNKTQKYTLPSGEIAYFNRVNFKTALAEYKYRAEMYGDKLSLQKLLENLADATGNSFNTIKHWSAGHNAPSDIEKVYDLAKVLDVDKEYLLTTIVEDNVMTNTVTDKNTRVYGDTKNVIRDIYQSMVSYIEMYRMIHIVHKEASTLKPLFATMYASLMSDRLDVPVKVFIELQDFTVNYLQQMGCWTRYAECGAPSEYEEVVDVYLNIYDCPPCAPWNDMLYVSLDKRSQYGMKFIEAINKQGEYIMEEEFNEFCEEVIIDIAYECLMDILGEYCEK